MASCSCPIASPSTASCLSSLPLSGDPALSGSASPQRYLLPRLQHTAMHIKVKPPPFRTAPSVLPLRSPAGLRPNPFWRESTMNSAGRSELSWRMRENGEIFDAPPARLRSTTASWKRAKCSELRGAWEQDRFFALTICTQDFCAVYGTLSLVRRAPHSARETDGLRFG